MQRTLCLSLCLLSACGASEATAPKTQLKQTIGPEGGTLALDGFSMTIPSGAVTSPTSIEIVASDDAIPSEFVATSRMFQCSPDGLSFGRPVTIDVDFAPTNQPVRVFWSSKGDPAFKDLGGVVEGSRIRATVLHFSRGFVGYVK